MPTYKDKQALIDSYKKGSPEVMLDRGEYTKLFDRGKGKFTLIAFQDPIHYDNGGQWEDIDTRITNGVVDKCSYVATPLLGEVGYTVILKRTGERIDVRLKKIDSVPVSYKAPIIDGHIIKWENLNNHADVWISFLPRMVRIWKQLPSATSAKSFEYEIIEDKNLITMRTRKIHTGTDSKGNLAKIQRSESAKVGSISTSTGKEVVTYIVTESVDHSVKVRDPITRKLEWKNEAQYPLTIDADVDIDIAVGADDSEDFHTGAGFPHTTAATFRNNWPANRVRNASATWSTGYGYMGETCLRFPGITIPQSATIDAATVTIDTKVDLSWDTTYDQVFNIKAKNANNPAAPTAANDVVGMTGLLATSVTTTATGSTYTSQSFNVATLVQTLVNSYDYSNEAMLFILRYSHVVSSGEKIEIPALEHETEPTPHLAIDYTSVTYRRRVILSG